VNSHVKRFIKRAVIKCVQPPLRVCVNLVQRVLTVDDQIDDVLTREHFQTSGDYLSYCQRKIVGDIHRQYGHIKVPGTLTRRPHYVWGVLNGAYLAHALRIKRISAIEFGVAGGNGLVILELIAHRVADLVGVCVDVYGFDNGKGSPKPVDYRDSPNLIHESEYPMDVDKLRRRLTSAHLILGPVDQTVAPFIETDSAPVGFVSFDMGVYSSTSKGLKLFDAHERILLPRVQCYFAASTGLTHSDFTADRLAIAEFNEGHRMRKISPCYGLEYSVPNAYLWAGRMYLAHIFDHSLYGEDDGLVSIRDNRLTL
jgi:hypothetical protein